MKTITTSLAVTFLVMAASLSIASQEREARLAKSTSSQSWQGFNIKDIRESSDEAFDLLDANDNGRITLDEIDIDFDTSSEEEARNMRRRVNLAHARFMKWDAEIDRFDIADTNKDAVLDREERENEDKSVRTHLLQLGLDELDTDKNGSIDRQEFGAHLADIETMDEDGNGYLTREELANAEDSDTVRYALGHAYEYRWAVERLERAVQRRAVEEAVRQKSADEAAEKQKRN
ncbi:MAG: hypothetical protein OXH84_06775 [Gammaproteobacteria bacterium]|nr:hypothetical protein [Gammaproteobacteria bacterium]